MSLSLRHCFKIALTCTVRTRGAQGNTPPPSNIGVRSTFVSKTDTKCGRYGWTTQNRQWHTKLQNAHNTKLHNAHNTKLQNAHNTKLQNAHNTKLHNAHNTNRKSRVTPLPNSSHIPTYPIKTSHRPKRGTKFTRLNTLPNLRLLDVAGSTCCRYAATKPNRFRTNY